MTTGRKDVQTAIVLQGGGALGAYEYGVLRALYEQRPGFRPVAVAGVSIGAITAAVLGGARTDPISALDALWRAKLTVTAPTGPLGLPAQVDRSLAMLGNPGMYQLRAGLFTTPWTCGADDRCAVSVITTIIGFEPDGVGGHPGVRRPKRPRRRSRSVRGRSAAATCCRWSAPASGR